MISIPGSIPIRIYPYFWIISGLIAWMNTNSFLAAGIWMLAITISIIVHEFGHALTARFFGRTASIELIGLGGVTHHQGPSLSLFQRFMVILNGPLSGFILWGISYYLYWNYGTLLSPVLAYALKVFMYINLFWTVMNLLPVHPLDGGQLLSVVLELFFGMQGVRYGLLFGVFLGAVISLAFFMIGQIFAGALFMLLAFEGYRAWENCPVYTTRVRSGASKQSQSVEPELDLETLVKEAQEDLTAGRRADARQKLEEIRHQTRTGPLYVQSTEQLAQLLMQQGVSEESYMMLKQIQKQLSEEGKRVLYQLAYRKGDWKDVAILGDQVYQLYPGYETALINAMAHAALKEPKPTIGWIQRAISDGLPNVADLFDRPEFSSMRQDPAFISLRKEYEVK